MAHFRSTTTFLFFLLLSLTFATTHVRRGHTTNAEAFAVPGARDGKKMSLPLPPQSFIQKRINGQLRMVPSGKKGKRHAHSQTVLGKPSIRGIIRVTRNDGPTSYISSVLNEKSQYTLTSNLARAASITLPSICPLPGSTFALLAPTSTSALLPMLSVNVDELRKILATSGDWGILTPGAPGATENKIWSLNDCDTGLLSTSYNGVPAEIFDHAGNVGMTGSIKNYNIDNPRETVSALTFTFVSQ